MPWKASSVLDEKLRSVFEYERDEQTMTKRSPACYSFQVPHHSLRHTFWRMLAH
jgi:hypothetical protein